MTDIKQELVTFQMPVALVVIFGTALSYCLKHKSEYAEETLCGDDNLPLMQEALSGITQLLLNAMPILQPKDGKKN